MERKVGRRSPALLVACLALFAALGGSVYAASRIDGHSIRAKSLPGNRIAPASIPADRLKKGTIGGGLLAPGSITGAQVDTATLGQVPTAVHADHAESARSATTALSAANAGDATTVNGHSAGCRPGTRAFAGACWQVDSNQAPATATAAALACANQGGELPDALTLAAFAQQPGITLAEGGEWSGDIPAISGPDVYAVITVSSAGQINFVASTATKRYRCVIPLVT